MIFRSVTQWAAVGTLAGAIGELVQAPGQNRMNVANGQTEWGVGALPGYPGTQASRSQPQLPVQRTGQRAPTAIWTREQHLHGCAEMRIRDGRTAVANDRMCRSPFWRALEPRRALRNAVPALVLSTRELRLVLLSRHGASQDSHAPGTRVLYSARDST